MFKTARTKHGPAVSGSKEAGHFQKMNLLKLPYLDHSKAIVELHIHPDFIIFGLFCNVLYFLRNYKMGSF